MLQKTITQFLLELQENKPLVLEQDGGWHQEWSIRELLHKMMGIASARLLSLGKEYCHQLDQLEATAVLFSSSSFTSFCQHVDFRSFLQAGFTLLSILEKEGSQKVLWTAQILKRRLIALQYRLESANGGLDREITLPLDSRLVEIAERWKTAHPLFCKKQLNELDIKRLLLTCYYPAFVNILLEDEKIQEEFLQWVLRDKIDPEVFIEYPALQRKISFCGLSGRIGRLGGKDLCIEKRTMENTPSMEEKIVTLPFEGIARNILDEKAMITFKGNYRLTMREIFEIFKNKRFRVGNLEYFNQGITNWNANYLGWWNADSQEYQKIDLEKGNWWQQLPSTKSLTKEEAQTIYGSHLDGIYWNISAVATRASATLDLFENHAYIEIIIPMDHDTYAIYDFGKAAKEFPIHPLEQVTRICENFLATVCYPDDNFFYMHRQHAYHSFPVVPEEGMAFMDSLKKDLQRAREDNLVYQIESENCAEWVQHKLEKNLGKARVPNLFRLPYLETEPLGVMGNIFAFIKCLPKTIQKEFLLLLHLPFGAKKGYWILENGSLLWKSMTTHRFWMTIDVYLPAFLHKQIESQHQTIVPLKKHLPASNKHEAFYENALRAIAPTSRSSSKNGFYF